MTHKIKFSGPDQHGQAHSNIELELSIRKELAYLDIMVGSIAQLLRMGETPERIQQAISAKIPGPPVAIEIIRMIAEHLNKLEKEN